MNKPGTIIGHELFLRCPFCGDSENNLHKAHFSVNTIKYVFHCYRCGISGKLTDAQMLSLIHELPNLNFITKEVHAHSRLLKDVLEELEIGAGSSRDSRLSRWHYGEHDAFLSRSAIGEVVGVHIRAQNKDKIKSYGVLAFGFAEDELLSSPKEPLRIVEGTYDVLFPRDVCVFGTISSGKLQSLVGHYVILCPDGDVWQRPELLKQFHYTVKQLVLNYNGRGSWITGIEYIPEGKDPDEVSPIDRQYIPIQTYLKSI